MDRPWDGCLREVVGRRTNKVGRGPYRAEELGDELGMTRRTAYRLLEALQRAGVELDRSPEGRVVYWRLRRESVERALGL